MTHSLLKEAALERQQQVAAAASGPRAKPSESEEAEDPEKGKKLSSAQTEARVGSARGLEL
ncbi:hypothetical protein C8J57DRAFT_1520614 [Mycena rebaudengoi]|nr:hypothetical protein C8J57DRAFT_1520614 [Mycena rebaudengoi]